jgi:arsenite methyltransferase
MRYAGRSEAEVEGMVASLAEVRERVLEAARIQPGETVLDVGAGLGLLTFGARDLVGETGQVVAVDVSVDALYELLAAAHETGTAGIALLLGSAEVLPLADASVDVAMTRSVLIYVRDKAEAAREFFRVCRPGGRISLFEPVNRRNPPFSTIVDLAELAPQMDEWHARRFVRGDPMIDFDVGDLQRLFEEAGFADVREQVVPHVQPIATDAVLTTPLAPGKQPILDEWRSEHGDESANRLAELFRAHGPRVELNMTQLYVTGRKP